MAVNAFDTILVESFDAIEQGESMDSVLSRYPAQANDLRPVLQVSQLTAAIQFPPTETARAASLQAALAETKRLATATTPPPRFAWNNLFRLAMSLGVVLLLFIVSAAGVSAAAKNALPGDPLYGVKRTFEEARLFLNNEDPGLQMEYAERRRSETRLLIAAGREENVQFVAEVSAIRPDSWLVDGDIPVIISRTTDIRGRPEVGSMVAIAGRTSSAGVFTTLISHEFSDGDSNSGGSPAGTATPAIPLSSTVTTTNTPTPTSTSTPTPTGTATATPTSTSTPTGTATATPTSTSASMPQDTVTPTSTPTPTPTSTSTPTPTGTATPAAQPTREATAPPAPTWTAVPPEPTPTAITNPTSTPVQEMVTICHQPGTPAQQTLTIPVDALNDHLAHGDTIGPCPENSPTPPPAGPTETAEP